MGNPHGAGMIVPSTVNVEYCSLDLLLIVLNQFPKLGELDIVSIVISSIRNQMQHKRENSTLVASKSVYRRA